jgi:hypothetical protein
MSRFTAGEEMFSPSALGRGSGGGGSRHGVKFLAHPSVLSRAGGTPPPNPLPKGEGEKSAMVGGYLP